MSYIKQLGKENTNIFGLAANFLRGRQLDQLLSEHRSQAAFYNFLVYRTVTIWMKWVRKCQKSLVGVAGD